MIVEETTGRRPARVQAFDTARGCAVVLVVFMHVTQQLQLTSPLPVGLTLFNWSAASIRMPLLFTLSGVLANGFLIRDRRDVVRRAGHFIWLVVVWGSVASLIHMVEPSNPSSPWSWIGEILLPQSPLWFIWALAIFTITIPIVARLSRGHVALTALVVTCLSYTPLLHGFFPDLPILKTARHSVFFYLGLMYARSIVDFVVTNRVRTIVLLAGAGAALHAVNGLTTRMLDVSLLLVPEKLALSMLALALAARLPQTRLTFGMQWLGKNTLPIFLGHMLFVDYLIGLQIGAGQLELSAGITLCSIAASICLKRFLDAAGFAWMYRLPIAIEAFSPAALVDEYKKGKLPDTLSRVQDTAQT